MLPAIPGARAAPHTLPIPTIEESKPKFTLPSISAVMTGLTMLNNPYGPPWKITNITIIIKEVPPQTNARLDKHKQTKLVRQTAMIGMSLLPNDSVAKRISRAITCIGPMHDAKSTVVPGEISLLSRSGNIWLIIIP